MKRLTRSQYAHAVRDLLGATNDVASSLPADERLGAFHHNTVAPVGRLDVEQYAEVAESLARAAVEKLDALVDCDRATLGDSACASQFIERFGLRVARRPLTSDERAEYSALFTRFGANDFGNGIRLLVQAMLQSPAFLYQPELAAPGPGARALDPYEVAARLALFLWDTVPDDTLLKAAAEGSLSTPAALQTRATAMLADPRARDTIESFHGQWLGIQDLPSVEKDGSVLPLFSPALARDMRDETLRFVDQVVLQGDGRLATLLTAPYSFPNGEVFGVYGVTRPAGYQPSAPFPLDPTQRAGLLTQPSFLTAHAHSNQTSPVGRGVTVLTSLLCAPPSPPPPNVNTRPPDPAPGLTTRARFAEHEASPACAGCHTVIDSIGFGFENYDALGVYRQTESGLPIDGSGAIKGGSDVDGPFVGAVALAQKLSQSEQVRSCVARQWFQYLFARSPGDADACSFWSSFEAFQASDYDIRTLLTAYVASDSFRFKPAGEP